MKVIRLCCLVVLLFCGLVACYPPSEPTALTEITEVAVIPEPTVTVETPVVTVPLTPRVRIDTPVITVPPGPTLAVEPLMIVVFDASGTPISDQQPCIVQATPFDVGTSGGEADLEAFQSALQPISDSYSSFFFGAPDPEVWKEIDGQFTSEGNNTWGTGITEIQVSLVNIFKLIYGQEPEPPLSHDVAEKEVIKLPVGPPVGPGGEPPKPRISLPSEFYAEISPWGSEQSVAWMENPLGALWAAQRASEFEEYDLQLQQGLLGYLNVCSTLTPGSPERQVAEQGVSRLLGIAAERGMYIFIEPDTPWGLSGPAMEMEGRP
jgi:hypothetical protein